MPKLLARSWLRIAVLMVAVGTLVVSLWCEHVEDQAFVQIVDFAQPQKDTSKHVITSQANAVLLLHQVHHIVKGSVAAMGSNNSMDGRVFWSASDHLRHPGGACASYSTVLAKTLQTAGYSVRKVGLAHDGQKAIHHVLEALVDGHWMVMDGGFDLTFTRPDGIRASASEVASNWDYYRQQTPVGYPAAYDYRGFYYTNWDRIPGAHFIFGLWPSLKDWADQHQVSLRYIFLNPWNWVAVLCGGLTILILVSFIRPANRRPALPRFAKQVLLRAGLF